MNATHIHLLINHLPVLLIPFATLYFAHAVKFGNESSRKFALILLIFAGLSAIPADVTGDEAADIAKNIPGVTKETIHEHDEAADFALWAGIITAVAAVAPLVLKDKKRKIATIVTFVIAIWACTVMARTAYLGGKIRHTEFDNPPPASAEDSH